MQRKALAFVIVAVLTACEQGTDTTKAVEPAQSAATPLPAAPAAPVAPIEPEHLSLGSVWSFGSGSKGTAALTKGWATPEPWGTWSMAKSGSITLSTAPEIEGKSLELTFVTQGFVNEKVPSQTVKVSSGGQELATWTFHAPLQLGVQQKLAVPSEVRVAGKPLLLEFAMPNAASPKAIGESGDERDLAIGVVSVTVTKAE